MSRPLIGITSCLEPARWGAWIREAAVVATPFLREVDRAGGLPVVLAPVHPRGVPELVERFDALVFTTGAPVGAEVHGVDSGPGAPEPDARRDRFEIALIQAAIAAGRPFLAIDRGLQVLNAAAGGAPFPYVQEGASRLADVDVAVSLTSSLGKAVGDSVRVRRAPGPGINRVGSGLLPVAWDDEQAVQALEVSGNGFGIGVRWHPEEGTDRRLFEELVAKAAH
ncbi:gamma-glutamyl-gamma-aminobutyrate hydrolase family protein [Nocardiopsis ansamitocini]|uniref:Gamma-glutamyl-gamma-aminobutyrate hydrolase n=1 Tax=Nocardiopsis ansamitocini TaxID=1670832 RepID=A0A9W6P2B0_9ACTN|nr:gamma-glutamyl-gamma-aminobutyrate hydrolase family protein [Nocardiopsis ansamitocini]GLU45801.1 gamma-glutamyl-gamma-aminobutyrate hydrolase [Nocardiopsis ansamitocini]